MKLLTLAAAAAISVTLVAPAAAAPAAPAAERTITVAVYGAKQYDKEIRAALKIWDDALPEVKFAVVNSWSADVQYQAASGWPYAAGWQLGRGQIKMGRQAVDEGHDVTRIASHEMGHILGLPDRRTGKCEDLMSGASAGKTCKNPLPNAAEISEVRGYFQGRSTVTLTLPGAHAENR